MFWIFRGKCDAIGLKILLLMSLAICWLVWHSFRKKGDAIGLRTLFVIDFAHSSVTCVWQPSRERQLRRASRMNSRWSGTAPLPSTKIDLKRLSDCFEASLRIECWDNFKTNFDFEILLEVLYVLNIWTRTAGLNMRWFVFAWEASTIESNTLQELREQIHSGVSFSMDDRERMRRRMITPRATDSSAFATTWFDGVHHCGIHWFLVVYPV